MIHLVVGERGPRVARIVERLAGPTSGADLDFVALDGSEVEQAEIESAAASLPFMGGLRTVVVRNAPASGPKGQGLLKWVAGLAAAPPPSLKLIVVFYADGMDRSQRAALEARVKAVKGENVRSEILRQLSRSSGDPSASQWVLELCREIGLEIEPSAVDFLISRTALDGGALEGEIMKVAALKAFSGRVTVSDIEQSDPHPAEQVIWSYLDAIVAKHTGVALSVLDSAIEQGDEPEYVLALLASTLRRLILTKELAARKAPEQEVAAVLGVPPWQARRAQGQAAAIPGDDLRRMLAAVVDLDYRQKSGRLEHGGLARGLDALTVRFCYRTFKQEPAAKAP